MRIVFWGNGNRGVACLRALCERGYRSKLAVAHPPARGSWHASVAEVAGELDIPAIAPDDPNDASTAAALQEAHADVFVLAGYGKILRRHIIDIPRLMCINLHAGKVPEYRGSSPLNWALINGEGSFGLSVLKLDGGVDSGDVLMQREFEISGNDTIRELHGIANEQFPVMLLEVIKQLKADRCSLAPQDTERARYYPLRFPDDGLVLWDQLSARQVHNRIRALTDPYPCAFTFFNGRKVKLIASEPASTCYNGEPGRVYRKTDRGLLVCAADTCVWIKQACFADDDTRLADGVQRYDRLATVRGLALAQLEQGARG